MRLPFAVAALAAASLPAAASAAPGPPPPTAVNGHHVQTVARGLPTPTSFAFARGTTFVGAFGSESDPKLTGGVFTVAAGRARQLTTGHVFGLAWRRGALYVADGRALVVYRGWNGRRFASHRVIFRPSRSVPSFNGIAFGHDGRLYAGVSFGERYSNTRDPARYAQSVISMRPDGTHVRIEARGVRQPYQLVFVRGLRYPFVTSLAQEGRVVPPDQIVIPRHGADFGFPYCNRLYPRTCAGYRRPFYRLPAHASPTGIAAIRRTLYIALFGGRKPGHPEVVTLSANGRRRAKPFLRGFVAPVISVGTHLGWIYTGDVTGTVYRVRR